MSTRKHHEQLEAAEDPIGAEEDPLAPLQARIEELERKLEEAHNERLRAIADFQNYRRRNESEKTVFRQLATENLVSDLLPILDNFERSMEHLAAGADPDRILQGIQMVERQLRSVLESQNLRRIEAKGQPFDPALHEAVSIEETTEHPHDTVMEELEPGYRLGEKVIRPARVKVAKSE